MESSNELIFNELKRTFDNEKNGVQQEAEKKAIEKEAASEIKEKNSDAEENQDSNLETFSKEDSDSRNSENKVANTEWIISKRQSYESRKAKNFDDSSDVNDDKSEPEIWHLNRPGRGKHLPPYMDSDSSDDSAKVASKRMKLTDDVDSYQDLLAPESRPLRTFKKIPIFIVDYHNDVMNFLYRAIATRHLPLQGNVLLHFDSHPDMVVSNELCADTCFEKEELLNEVSIENWIIPACFSGQFGRVIWFKNSWSKQFDSGNYEFHVGSINKKLGVDMPHSYYVAEGSYYATEQLKQKRKIKLDVFEVDTQEIDAASLLDASEDVNRCILDIDLDYFSTANPFLEIYPLSRCYEQLKSIFQFKLSDDLLKASEQRRKQLDSLHEIFQHLVVHRSLPNHTVLDAVITSEIFSLIEKLYTSLCANYDESSIDWIQIFNAGCTIDDAGLPHHLSSAQELEKHYERFKQFLQKLPFPPVCVTIACSAEDNYTPPQQMENILDNVLKILYEVYTDKINNVPIRYDGSDNFNIYNL